MKILFRTMGQKYTPPDQTGSWDARKGRLKAQFPILNDHDLYLEASNRETMFQNLLTKLGVTSEELHSIIRAL